MFVFLSPPAAAIIMIIRNTSTSITKVFIKQQLWWPQSQKWFILNTVWKYLCVLHLEWKKLKCIVWGILAYILKMDLYFELKAEIMKFSYLILKSIFKKRWLDWCFYPLKIQNGRDKRVLLLIKFTLIYFFSTKKIKCDKDILKMHFLIKCIFDTDLIFFFFFLLMSFPVLAKYVTNKEYVNETCVSRVTKFSSGTMSEHIFKY